MRDMNMLGGACFALNDFLNVASFINDISAFSSEEEEPSAVKMCQVRFDFRRTSMENPASAFSSGRGGGEGVSAALRAHKECDRPKSLI